MEKRPPLEVADILMAYADTFLEMYGDAVSSARRRVIRDLMLCRTAALGGHVERCDKCGHARIAYDSCRNRHCPKCQGIARARWLEARVADLLPVEYFHVVFTVPEVISELALQNKRVMYDILMRASAETLTQVAADPRHLGARIGVLSVLHTWGQNLQHHPHVHCVVPGGGLSPDHKRWVPCRPGFFLPVKVLGRVFRGKFLNLTRQAYAGGKLQFQGHLAHLDAADTFAAHLKQSYATDWVVYAKPPFGGPEQVLKYLARYTHRVAISNHRLLSIRDGKVRFRWKDYAHGNRKAVMTLDAVEFIRRFLLHVLPKGFVRIRQSGFLANRCRRELIDNIRELLSCDDQQVLTTDLDEDQTCPECREGLMVRVLELPKVLRRPSALRVPALLDSS